MKIYTINALSNQDLQGELQRKIDLKTKPRGALGKLEELALQIGLIQESLTPELKNPHILVFAADHGIAQSGVSAYPQEVTWQMVYNFLQGGAAINVFCRQQEIELLVIDAGINYDFKEKASNFIDAKVAKGTQNFLEEPAMTTQQAEDCLEKGSNLVNRIYLKGCNVIGFGEMGIGNTSSASIITSLICHQDIATCTGRGTGLGKEGLARKIILLEKALKQNGQPLSPIDILATYGGFEIGQMAGAMLAAAEKRMIILIDGFICTAAFLLADTINPLVKEYAIFCHQSEEKGHKVQLDFLQAKALLSLNLRLGEGTGTAIAYPIVKSAIEFLTHMASFESAGVSNQ